MSRCGVMSSTPGGRGPASDFDDGNCRLGGPRIGSHRLWYRPQQDVRWRSRNSASEPLTQQDQALGQW